MIQEKDIQNLVSQAQEGDSEAFGRIYDIFSKQIYNFLFGKLRHRQTAEDLTHTVFLKAWTNLRSYKPRSSAKFSTWLYQIANFTLIDHWRTRKTTAELSDIENLARFAEDPKLYEEYEYLWIAISELPLEYQTVLDLRFKQALSVEETAQIMDKSRVGIRVLQHRALKALKSKLKHL
ncbi:MAG: RNA polymerase sigma factor [Candidatus Doudnabacteria bacterium]